MYELTQKNPHGGDAYLNGIALDFSANVNPLGMPPAVLAAARTALETAHRYPDPHCRTLVSAIAAAEAVPEQYVLCGNGAAELIFAYCAAARPRRAIEPAPTFSEYAAALTLAGGEMLRYPLARENAFLPDRDFLGFLEWEQPETVFLCSPNNPTGRLFPPALLDEVFEYCKQKSIRLFVDECFLELSDAPESPLKGRLEEYPGLVLLRAFTKSYGMAGLRLGYCLSADSALLASMAARTPPWNVSAVAQAAGVAALRESEFLTRTRSLIAAERPKLKAGLEALGLWVCPSEANFLLFRGPESLGTVLREKGAAVRDCANFPGLGPGWYRTAVRTPEENAKLLSLLK